MERTRWQTLLLPGLLLCTGLACSFAGSNLLPTTPAPTPAPSAPASLTPPLPAASPTPAGGFSDFLAFAVQIDKALQARDVAFFAGLAAPSSWDCLGDETQGICLGQSAGRHMEGIPVADEWKTYTLYSQAQYETLWSSAFKRVHGPRLVALASQSGANPLMPAADQSFQAVITAAKPGVAKGVGPLRVLYFEYVDDAWRLQGELTTLEHAQDWLQGNCADCYDTWSAWPK